MPTSNYPFLARNQKTEEDKQRDNINSLWNQLGVIGVNGQNSFSTGYGNDNQLQPERPTGILNTNQGPRTVHEGERLDVEQNGEFSVTPASQVGGQANLQDIEQKSGMRGYQYGTITHPRDRVFSEKLNTPSDQSANEEFKEGFSRKSNIDAITNKSSPITTTIAPQMEQTISRTPGTIAPPSVTVKPVGSDMPVREAPKIAPQAPAQTLTVQKPTVQTPTAQTATSGRGSFSYGEAQEPAGATAQPATSGTRRGAFSYGEQPQEVAPVETPTPAEAPATTPDENIYEPYRERGLQRLERYADVESPREAAIRAGERERFAGEAAAAKGALTQEMAQYGIQGREAATESARLGRQIGSQESQLISDLRKQEGERAFTAARQIPGEARAEAGFEMAEKQLEFEREKYGDQQFTRMADDAQTTSFESWQQKYPDATREDYEIAREYKARQLKGMDIGNEAARLGVDSNRLQAFVTAVNQGSDLIAANTASGLNLNAEQYMGIKRDYTYEGQAQQATISRLIGELGDQRVNSISNMVGRGGSLDQINDAFGLDLSVDDFQNILGATPYGESQWQKTLGGANMLLQTMDPTNIAEAERVLEGVFPGISFDMNQLIQDVGADRYAQSMTDLATLASTFSTWDEAKKSAEGLNLIEDLGITEENAVEMFEGLKLNAIDEEWDAITESKAFQSFDEDTQQLIRDTLTAGLTGELEFDITPSYQVTDASGNLVQAFDNIADANKYLGENADKGYSVDEQKNYVYKNIMSGDTITIDNAGNVVGEGGAGERGIAESFDAFYGTIPGDEDVTLDAWIKAGKPKSYDEYLKLLPELPSTIPLESIEIEEYSDLLTKDNYEKLTAAYESNPDDVKDSEYYYELPSKEFVFNNVNYDLDMWGKRTTKLDGEFKEVLEKSVGKLMEFKTYELGGAEVIGFGDEGTKKVSGQLVKIIESPGSIQLQLKDKDGSYTNYVLA